MLFTSTTSEKRKLRIKIEKYKDKHFSASGFKQEKWILIQLKYPFDGKYGKEWILKYIWDFVCVCKWTISQQTLVNIVPCATEPLSQ